MCLECDGWTRDEVLELMRRQIAQSGWAVQAVEAGRSEPPFAYTVGLTRYHGHPELLVSGRPPTLHAPSLLDELGDDVAAGRRWGAGDSHPGGPGRRGLIPALQLVRIPDPRHLVTAQEIYAGPAGPVPALQVVWADEEGRWPWEGTGPVSRREQQLFGRPLRGR